MSCILAYAFAEGEILSLEPTAMAVLPMPCINGFDVFVTNAFTATVQ